MDHRDIAARVLYCEKENDNKHVTEIETEAYKLGIFVTVLMRNCLLYWYMQNNIHSFVCMSSGISDLTKFKEGIKL